MNLFTWLIKQNRWSTETFGAGVRTEGNLKHIEKEIAEVRANPSSLEEWCDIVAIALDGAMRAGHTAYQVCQQLERKLDINRFHRSWPPPNDGTQPVEHIRADEGNGQISALDFVRHQANSYLGHLTSQEGPCQCAELSKFQYQGLEGFDFPGDGATHPSPIPVPRCQLMPLRCPACGGTGDDPFSDGLDRNDCPNCGGTGFLGENS